MISARAVLYPAMSPAAASGVSAGIEMPGGGDHDGRQGTIHGPRRPGRDAGRLDGAVEAFVEVPEALVVQPVARLVGVEQHQDETGLVRLPTDAARRLDIFGGGLWLALHDHETEPADVEADRDHVGGKRHVDPVASDRRRALPAPPWRQPPCRCSRARSAPARRAGAGWRTADRAARSCAARSHRWRASRAPRPRRCGARRRAREAR